MLLLLFVLHGVIGAAVGTRYSVLALVPLSVAVLIEIALLASPFELSFGSAVLVAFGLLCVLDVGYVIASWLAQPETSKEKTIAAAWLARHRLGPRIHSGPAGP